MDINDNIESPMLLNVSFNKLLEHYEKLAESKDEFLSAKAKRVLKTAAPYPELRDGFSNMQILQDREQEIGVILQDSFAPVLTKNEIKTASVPFHDLIFNSSERFKNIIKNAGDNFELNIKNMPDDHRYIIACTVILNFCYGYNLNFKRPFYYEIPDTNGINRYYKILYNADFCEIVATDKAKKITDEDYKQLLDNFDNLELWKEKFPPDSYIFKGFVISNIFDVTEDQSISNIKSSLIGEDKRKDEGFMKNFHEIFRSLLGINDIKVGFSIYNAEEDIFERVYGVGMHSYLLGDTENKKCSDSLCSWSYNRLLVEKKYFSVSDVDRDYQISKGKVPHISNLRKQGIKSAIFAPIANDEGLMGIIEIVSATPQTLNSINANKLIDIMPFIVSAVERSKKEEENLIEAVIQKECTSIHPSVHWRFAKEAKNFIKAEMEGHEATFKKVAFENVYPLYGQIDIKEDLSLQLKAAKDILEKAFEHEGLPIYEQFIYQINDFENSLNENFQVDSEQQISSFFKQDIEPLLNHLKQNDLLKKEVKAYYDKIDEKVNVLYKHRKDYDKTIAKINREMAALLDKKQEDAQLMYPHFFERFKTDGVEHNL
jgi:hypothetical protein